jgi:hypothetical protein
MRAGTAIGRQCYRYEPHAGSGTPGLSTTTRQHRDTLHLPSEYEPFPRRDDNSWWHEETIRESSYSPLAASHQYCHEELASPAAHPRSSRPHRPGCALERPADTSRPCRCRRLRSSVHGSRPVDRNAWAAIPGYLYRCVGITNLRQSGSQSGCGCSSLGGQVTSKRNIWIGTFIVVTTPVLLLWLMMRWARHYLG